MPNPAPPKKGPSCGMLVVVIIVSIMIMAGCSSLLGLGKPSPGTPQHSQCSQSLPVQDYFDCLKRERGIEER